MVKDGMADIHRDTDYLELREAA